MPVDTAKQAAKQAFNFTKAAAKIGLAEVKKQMGKDDKDKDSNAPVREDAGESDGARFLYEVLLPFLNCRTLLANVTPKTLDFAALPIGGAAVAPSHVATEAARFVMRGSGLSAAHASQLLVLLRWTILRMAEEELKQLTTVSNAPPWAQSPAPMHRPAFGT